LRCAFATPTRPRPVSRTCSHARRDRTRRRRSLRSGGRATGSAAPTSRGSVGARDSSRRSRIRADAVARRTAASQTRAHGAHARNCRLVAHANSFRSFERAVAVDPSSAERGRS
jgi:hypothetical protein